MFYDKKLVYISYPYITYNLYKTIERLINKIRVLCYGVYMKRKVIQIANSTQLVSLPRKWAIEHNVKKGDELELEIIGNRIEVSTERKNDTPSTIKLDITGLDRSSLMFYIRSAYRRGYDVIDVQFNKQLTPHYRLNKDVRVISIIHQEVNRLVGVEVVTQRENYCQIRDISKGSIQEFDAIMRRIFLLLIDASKDFEEAANNNDLVLAETIEEKHDSITKFVSYCLRLLNKEGYKKNEDTTFLFYMIAVLDRIIDYFKYAARDVIAYKKPLKKETKKGIDLICKSLQMYYDTYYKFEMKKVTHLYENRDDVIKYIKSLTKKVPTEEVLLLNNLSQVHELLVDLTAAKTSMSFNLSDEENQI